MELGQQWIDTLHTLIWDDEFAAVPVFNYICTAPVFVASSPGSFSLSARKKELGYEATVVDDGGCNATVFTTVDCNVTENIQNSSSASM